MVELAIVLFVSAIILLAILYIISIWVYKRAPANMGFVRTGFLGTKVCLGRGAMVLPVFHEISWVSLETIKLIVSRTRDQAVLTSDKIRVDISTELYAHVGRTETDLLAASRSLGEKTFDAEKVRNLLEAKIVGAIRSYAATKTLSELHENRDAFGEALKDNVVESFKANGLDLEEVTVVTLEQSGKEFFKTDNIFDAEGLKIITEITSDAKRKVHETEKRTTVAIRQKDLDTQVELLDIDRQEANARANQDKAISNEQALQLGEKQVYVLDQRMIVEAKEIENEVDLERLRTERDIALTEEARKRETSDIRIGLALEQERRDREIALIHKTKEEELAEVQRKLDLEKAEKDRQIQLIAKEQERQQSDILRTTEVLKSEEEARKERHLAEEVAALQMRKQSLQTTLEKLELEKEEAIAEASQEKEISNEKARVLSEQQRFILDQRWEVEQEEIIKELALEKEKIKRDAEIIEESKAREVAEIKRTLAQEIEEQERQITIIEKEKEREIADIQRFQAREQEERDREIAFAQKTKELENAEADRLRATAEKEKALKAVDSVRVLADAEVEKEVVRIGSEKEAESRRIDEENKAQITRMHMITQAEARKLSSEQEAEATITRAKATSEAQKITAEGMEVEAGAEGRAEMEIDTLRIENTQRMLEAEATGLEAKAGALKKYNDAATFLELAKLQIEADRDVHIDQAKAMGSALTGAQIRMYGGGDDTVDTIRKMFTSGFSIGEALEGMAQSLPEGLRSRFAENGVRGLLGRPIGGSQFVEIARRLTELVDDTMPTEADRALSFVAALEKLEDAAGDDALGIKAVDMLKEANEGGGFDDVPFESVWVFLQAALKIAG